MKPEEDCWIENMFPVNKLEDKVLMKMTFKVLGGGMTEGEMTVVVEEAVPSLPLGGGAVLIDHRD